MVGWRPGLPLDAEPTQVRDLPPLVLATLAEVYANARRIRDDAKDLAELYMRCERDIYAAAEPQGLDEPPVCHYSGMFAAAEALEAIVAVILDTLWQRTEPSPDAEPPSWPATAAPLPDMGEAAA